MDERLIQVKIEALLDQFQQSMDRVAASTEKNTNRMAQQIDKDCRAMDNSMQKMASQATSSVKEMHSQITSFLTKIGAAVAGVGALLAGGQWFKRQIDETVKWNSEARSLSKSLGITTEEASALNETIQDLGVATLNNNLNINTLKQALSMMRRELANNEEAFNDLGIETRESNGEFKNSLDIFLAAMGYLSRLKGETAQNVQGIKLFKRSWEEVRPLMGLTEEAIAKTSEELRKQGREVTAEGIQKSIAYKQALDQLDDAQHALSLTIGNAVTPALTRMAQGLNWVLERLGEVITASTSAEAAIGNFWAAAGGGEEIPTGGGSDWGGESPKRRSGGGADMEKSGPGAGGGKGGGGASLLQEWKEELETLKTEENAFLDFSKEREKAFWQEKLEQCKEGSKEYLAVRRELFTLEKGMAKEAVTLQLAELDRQMTSEKTNWQQRLALEDQKLAILASKYGQSSMQYAQELKKKQILLEAADKAERELQQQKLDNELKLQQMSLAAKEEEVRFKQQMGLISGMAEARMLADLKKQELGLEQTYFEQSLELWQGYEKKIEEIIGRRNEFYQKKALELQKIDEKQALAGKQRWENFLQPLNQALETSIQGVILGTNKMGKALASSAQSILAAWVGMLGKKLTTWIATELGMLQSTTAGAAARAGVETAAAATSKGVKAAAGSAGIIAAAAEAAAEAYKAVVGIYIIGPILAPIAAATAFAGVMAYKALIPSAAGGWDVPEDTLAYVHKDEKILPAGIAKSLDRISLIVNRLNMPTPWPNWTVPAEAFDFGLSPQFSAALARREDSQPQQIHKTETHVHNNIQAWDSRDVGRFVRDQGAGMADGLARGAARNYSGRRLWRRW